MKTINIKFINFWSNFNNNSWFKYWQKIFSHPKIVWTNNSNEKIDILVSSVFGKSIDDIIHFDGYKILYTRENLNHQQYQIYQNHLNLFNLVIGFNDTNNGINIPYYYRLMIEYGLTSLNTILDLSINRKNLCLISRNPHKLRLSLLESFKQKNYMIDCPGLVGNNMSIKVSNGFNKINFMKNYYFNICPENSYATGYTTEKLFDCCVAGCIPIYYGCDNLSDGFYNRNRILYIKQNLSNYNQIVDQTIYLLNNKSELISFMNQKPFSPYIDHYVTTVKNKINTILETLL